MRTDRYQLSGEMHGNYISLAKFTAFSYDNQRHVPISNASSQLVLFWMSSVTKLKPIIKLLKCSLNHFFTLDTTLLIFVTSVDVKACGMGNSHVVASLT